MIRERIAVLAYSKEHYDTFIQEVIASTRDWEYNQTDHTLKTPIGTYMYAKSTLSLCGLTLKGMIVLDDMFFDRKDCDDVLREARRRFY